MRRTRHLPLRPLGAKTLVLAVTLALLSAGPAAAGDRERAKRIHDRLAGVPPTESVLQDMASDIDAGNVEDAAYTAMENPHFYDVTLKNFVMPWTNESQTVFAPLNDYVATVIGMIRDGVDFREILYGDILYVGNVSGLPAYATDGNAHYEELEAAVDAPDTSLKDVLERRLQSNMNPELPPQATAGVLTTRQAAKAFFIDGTNRAMFRFTLINHFCRDLEQVKDTGRPTDRIRQDVSRSPGGDSRIFNNNCVACHAGMDPLAQAYAFYNYQYDEEADPDGDNGRLIYNSAGETDPETESRVTAKHRVNANNFAYGYIIRDDSWDNYWRQGQNQTLDWDFSSASVPGAPNGSGSGMKSMGKELAGSRAFAECQVEKVFETVCLRPPVDSADRSQVDQMVSSFRTSGFNMKSVFADAAVYCSTDVAN